MSLLRVIAGRPPILDFGRDGRVYLAVHDEYHLRTLRDFKNRLRLCHPDMSSTHQVAASTVTKRVVSYGVDRGEVTYTLPAYTQRKRRTEGRRFRELSRRFEKWKRQEERWYRQYGLTPPAW